MKTKVLLAALCLSMATLTFAQNRPTDPQARRQAGGRGNFDQVVDTAVLNHMNLPQATLDKVLALQKSKNEEMRKSLQDARPQKGQRLSEGERKELQQKREQFTANYRKELRTILGDADYITYLEKQLDRRPAFQMGGRQQQGPRQGQAQMQRQQLQRQMQQGFDD